MRKMNAAAIAAVAGVLWLVGLPLEALAQSAPAAASSSTVVDFRPLLDSVGYVLAALVAGVGAELLRRWTGVQMDDRAKATVENAIKYGLALGAARVVPDGKAAVDVRSEVVSTALEYVNRHAVCELGRLKIDPKAVVEKIEARLAHAESAL
jgi:hypothetical protein